MATFLKKWKALIPSIHNKCCSGNLNKLISLGLLTPNVDEFAAQLSQNVIFRSKDNSFYLNLGNCFRIKMWFSIESQRKIYTERIEPNISTNSVKYCCSFCIASQELVTRANILSTCCLSRKHFPTWNCKCKLYDRTHWRINYVYVTCRASETKAKDNSVALSIRRPLQITHFNAFGSIYWKDERENESVWMCTTCQKDGIPCICFAQPRRLLRVKILVNLLH